MTIGVERNICYNKTVALVSHLEGEEGIVEMKNDPPNATKPILNIPSQNPILTPPRVPSPVPEPDPPTEKRIQNFSPHSHTSFRFGFFLKVASKGVIPSTAHVEVQFINHMT